MASRSACQILPVEPISQNVVRKMSRSQQKFSSKSNWLYPFLQLGLTTGANDFLIPIGAGIVIAKKLSISGGSVFGVGKGLTNLNINSYVKDEAALKNDLSNQVISSWYFSLNYNFFK